MTEVAAPGDPVLGRAEAETAAVAAGAGPDARRVLQLALAGLWLLDAVLQYQRHMFTRAFGQMLAASATGNPAVIAGPIRWDAGLVEHHVAAMNAIFATIQLLLGLGIAIRATVRPALAASVAWSLAVWWLGEGLGGVLAGTASPLNGAPGAALLYALLAVLLWPADRMPRMPRGRRMPLGQRMPRGRRMPLERRPALGLAAPFTAARFTGTSVARALWLVLWLSLAYLAIAPANRAPKALSTTIAGMGRGEPGWLASVERSAASLAAGQGLAWSVALGVLLSAIAVGVYLPRPALRACLLLAVAVALLIWVFGEAFGMILAGGATDPNSGPLLALLAVAYWPGGADGGPRAAQAGTAAP